MWGRNADWSVTLLGGRAGALVVRTVDVRDVTVRARGVRGEGGGGGGGLGIPWMHVLSGRSHRSQYSSATRQPYGPPPRRDDRAASYAGSRVRRPVAEWSSRQLSGAVSTFRVNFSARGAQSSLEIGLPSLEDFTDTA